MMLFLFIVLIVILNILIAQLSDTYAEVKSDAQRTLEQNWAEALRNLEQSNKFEVSQKQPVLGKRNICSNGTSLYQRQVLENATCVAMRNLSQRLDSMFSL